MSNDEDKKTECTKEYIDFPVYNFNLDNNLIYRMYLMNAHYSTIIPEFKPVGEFQDANNYIKDKKEKELYRASDKTKKLIEESMDVNSKYVLNVLISMIVHQIQEAGDIRIANMEEASENDDLLDPFGILPWIYEYNDNSLTYPTTQNCQGELTKSIQETLKNKNLYNVDLAIDFAEKFMCILAKNLSIITEDTNKLKKIVWQNLFAPMMLTRNNENYFSSWDIRDAIKDKFNNDRQIKKSSKKAS